MRWLLQLVSVFALAAVWFTVPALAGPDAKELYAAHCASCHGPERLGGTGPVLLPDSFGRLKKEQIHKVIANGRPATQMPAFADKLGEQRVRLLAGYVLRMSGSGQ